MTDLGEKPVIRLRGYAKGRARRESIIQTATRHFAERGFTSATIAEIAAACDITRAGLLHYFGDKEALLEAVLEERDREDYQRFRPYAKTRGGIGILRGMADLAEHNRLVPGLIDLFARLSVEASSLEHPAHRYFVERYERIRSGTTRALRQAAEAGYLLPDVDPDVAAVRLTALMDGLQVQWLMDNNIDMAWHMKSAILEYLTDDGIAAFAQAEVHDPASNAAVDGHDKPVP